MKKSKKDIKINECVKRPILHECDSVDLIDLFEPNTIYSLYDTADVDRYISETEKLIKNLQESIKNLKKSASHVEIFRDNY